MTTDTPAAAPITAEREAFERAMKQSWKMVDPLRPPNAGSYWRGEHEGICAALKTVRENFERALLSAPVAAQPADSAMEVLREARLYLEQCTEHRLGVPGYEMMVARIHHFLEGDASKERSKTHG